MISPWVKRSGIFLIIPGMVLFFSVLLKVAAGPYWLAPNFDPSYLYLINGLHIFKGIAVNDATHPGTPLQVLCGMVCWLFNIGRSMEDTVTRVLITPEFYLHMVFIILTSLSFFTSFGLGVYVFRKTNDIWAALLAQLPSLSFLVMKSWESFEPVLPVAANVSPECMLVGVLNLFTICLLMNFFAKTPKENLASTMYWGLISGLGVAVKFTFLPILLVPCIVLSWKNKIIFLGVCVATFFVSVIPALSQYPIALKWVSGFVMHGGHFQSEAGGINMSNSILNWKNIIMMHWMCMALLLSSLTLVFGRMLSHQWDKATLFILATILGILFQFSIVTQNPGAHYLLPGLGLLSPLLVLFYLQSVEHHILIRKMAVGLILVGILWQVGWATGYLLKLDRLTRDIRSFDQEIATKYQNCTIIDYYRSSDQQAALFFGDGWNLSLAMADDLFRVYPNKYFFHLWRNRLMSFKDRVWAEDLLTQNPCVLLRGDGQFDFSQGPYHVRLLEKGRFESLHLLAGSTERQAALLLAASMHFLQTGAYDKALACALEARRLHYQPESSVENLIALFESHL